MSEVHSVFSNRDLTFYQWGKSRTTAIYWMVGSFLDNSDQQPNRTSHAWCWAFVWCSLPMEEGIISSGVKFSLKLCVLYTDVCVLYFKKNSYILCDFFQASLLPFNSLHSYSVFISLFNSCIWSQFIYFLISSFVSCHAPCYFLTTTIPVVQDIYSNLNIWNLNPPITFVFVGLGYLLTHYYLCSSA